MEPLGYARWENFITVIKRAIESCKSTGFDPEDHFRGVTKMVTLGSDAKQDSVRMPVACSLLRNLEIV
jgi:DNA-damage-inducible protein D